MTKEMALRLYPQVIRNSGREIQSVLVVVTLSVQGLASQFP